MARAKGRGGPRTPRRPAAVSGPGALSARTDGGPGQPIRVAPGGDYGDRKASVDQQRAAPLATKGGGPPQATGGGRPAPGGQYPNGIFSTPTDLPGEPMTAGIDVGAGPGRTGPILQEDPNLALRALAQRYPHPDLLRILARVSHG